MINIEQIRAALELADGVDNDRMLWGEQMAKDTAIAEALAALDALKTEVAGLNQRNANLQFMLGEVAKERDQLRARLAEYAEAPAVLHALIGLVAGLDRTNWSSWQTTAHFAHALENARDVLAARPEAK